MENKVYLNTVEDLTKALKDGKTVYAMDEFCSGESKLELINNIPVRKDPDSEILIDGTIYFKANVFYLKEKEPLKIEVGKFYKNKKGDKCICAYESTDEKYKNRFLMIIIGALPESNSYGVDEEGKRDYEENLYDIVDYWEDK